MNSQFSLESVGKYRLTGEVLGKGNYSKVHLATDTETNRRVALKVIDLSNHKDSYIRRHYRREAILLEHAAHPNIIKFINAFELKSSFVMVLEVMPGTLRDFVQRCPNGRCEESYARVIFRQIASAVAYLHETGIVHRDIKLENVLYDRVLQVAKLAGNFFAYN